MKNTVLFTLIAALAALLIFPGCTKDEGVAPNTELRQSQSADGTILDLRGSKFPFPGFGSFQTLAGTESVLPTDLTGLKIPVPMVRKNFIEAANGAKIWTTWDGEALLTDPSMYLDATRHASSQWPYEWKGFFIDQHKSTDPNIPDTYLYIFAVTFTVDKSGKANGTLSWTGAKWQIGAPLPQ